MEFRTIINPGELSPKLTHHKPCLAVGSCFTTSIGEKLYNGKIKTIINPFGIIYNPISIANSLVRVAENKVYNENELLYFNEKFISLDHHGDFSFPEKERSLDKINSSINESFIVLKNSSHILITLGTAWVYEYIEKNKIVANCHKIPRKEFSKKLLSAESIMSEINKALTSCKKINPSLHFVFTLSPVRHLNDGFIENQLSKSVLHFVIQQLIKENKECSYFPAYEIMMDDLRDYRFYKEDMVHPNEIAIKYIWQKFCEFGLDNDSICLLNEVEQVNKAIQHKPFQNTGDSYKKFITSTYKKLELIMKKHPHLNWEKEIAFFSKAISN